MQKTLHFGALIEKKIDVQAQEIETPPIQLDPKKLD
jgi:hypothetical protein